MDPTEALAQLLRALHDGRTMTAVQHLTDIIEWLDKGGFPPKDAIGWGIHSPQFGPLIAALTTGDAPEAIREMHDLIRDDARRNAAGIGW
jgi:hypothetical protein